MSARFKSRDDYFSKHSDLTRKVLAAEPKKKTPRKRSAVAEIGSELFCRVFCTTVERYEIEGEGRFEVSGGGFGDALERHLEGSAAVLVNPCSSDGMTGWNVVFFDLSGDMDQPFSRAQDFAKKLDEAGIPTLLEVAEGGKGHYHLWIIHEKPVSAHSSSRAFLSLGRDIFGCDLDTIPAPGSDAYLPLPLQGETALLQRGVFVNAVGKMIRDQRVVLESFTPCSAEAFQAFLDKTASSLSETATIDEELTETAESADKAPVSIITREEIDRNLGRSSKKPVSSAPVKSAPDKPVQSVHDKPEKTASVKPERKAPKKPSPRAKTVSRPTVSAIVAAWAGENLIGVDASIVRQVVIPDDIEPFPSKDSPLAGIMRYGGRRIHVTDAARLVGGAGHTTTLFGTRAIVMERGGDMIALLVHTIAGYKRVASVRETDVSAGGFPVAFCEGETEPVQLIDTGALFGGGESGSSRIKRSETGMFLVIGQAGVSYAVDASSVAAVLSAKSATTKNGVSTVAYKGNRVQCVSLGRILDPGRVKPVDEDARGRIVIVGDGDTMTALGVDTVAGVMRLDYEGDTGVGGRVAEGCSVSGTATAAEKAETVYILNVPYLIKTMK